MLKITVAVLDKIHPQIKAAIAAASPADWNLRCIEENTQAAPMPKELIAEAAQLHFEIRKGSTPVDPTKYLGGA